jgi:hypothetical protein
VTRRATGELVRLPPMKYSVAAVSVVCALLLAPAAVAKGKYSFRVDRATARVGQPVSFVLTSSWAPRYNLRVFAIAPGKNWYDVVGTITGDSSIAEAQIPRDGFQVRIARVAPKRWRGVVKFPSAGRWRLVEPCGCERGISTPQATAAVVVR